MTSSSLVVTAKVCKQLFYTFAPLTWCCTIRATLCLQPVPVSPKWPKSQVRHAGFLHLINLLQPDYFSKTGSHDDTATVSQFYPIKCALYISVQMFGAVIASLRNDSSLPDLQRMIFNGHQKPIKLWLWNPAGSVKSVLINQKGFHTPLKNKYYFCFVSWNVPGP